MTETELARFLRPAYALAAVLAGVGALSAAIHADFGWFLIFLALVIVAGLGYEWVSGP